MPYWNSPKNAPVNIDSNTLLNTSNNKRVEFYEFEPAIVLDIILNKDHKYLKKASKESQYTLNPSQWQPDLNNAEPSKSDLDYTWVGRALVRLYYSQQKVEKEDLIWAYPLEANVSEYPLINEIVGVVNYLGKYYYTRKINTLNLPNVNVDFYTEHAIGGYYTGPESPILGNRELQIGNNIGIYKEFEGPKSKTTLKGGYSYEGVLGRYFYINKNIRSIKRREGDLILESRFGQSIRFGAYDDDRNNDIGVKGDFDGYKDYKGDGTSYIVDGKSFKLGGGNPMILIRNRQRPLVQKGSSIKQYENLPEINGTEEEKNVGGYILEDINNDGSSIHITSGVTPTLFKTNCSKKMWGNGEEQSGFQPGGSTKFKYPNPIIGDQIVINSDRIILSSKKEEMFHFSKKRMSFVTDGELTIDSHDQIVINTNNKTVINSPAIYLGEYDNTNEPVLLGQTTVNWLYELCDWLKEHTHWYKHTHPDTELPSPIKTQISVQIAKLELLQKKLDTLMSRRVFVTGGGLAPGLNGGSISNGAEPVKINVTSGTGVPGRFKGLDYRISVEEAKNQSTSLLKEMFPEENIEAEKKLAEEQLKNEEEGKPTEEVPPTAEEQQKIQELSEMSEEDKALAAKIAACGGRGARKTGVYRKRPESPTTGSLELNSNVSSYLSSSVSSSVSSSMDNSPEEVDPVEVRKWDNRIALLKKAGIEEKDSLPPPNIDIDDWKNIVQNHFK